MVAEHFLHSLSRSDLSPNPPKCMTKLLSKFWSGKRIFFVRSQTIEKYSSFFFVYKITTLICCEKFIQIKSIIYVFALDFYALFKIAQNNIGHLVCKKSHIWHIEMITKLIARFDLGFFSALFVNICPVKNLVFGKFTVGESPERRPR